MQFMGGRRWDGGNLAADVGRRGVSSLELGNDDKTKQEVKGIGAGRLDSG